MFGVRGGIVPCYPRTTPTLTRACRLSPVASPRPFTLVELLTVMVIMVAIMALIAPAFSNMATGSAVNSASRMVSSQLMLARQYAIANRCRVAVIMPRGVVENPTILVQYRYTSMRPAIVTGGGPFTFSRWVENTDWAFLPNGAAIAQADGNVGIQDGGGYRPNPYNTEIGMTTADDVNLTGVAGTGATAVDGVRAVVFHPTGRVEGGNTAFVTVAERMCVGNDAPPTVDFWTPAKDPGLGATQSGKNQLTLVVNRFTGRVETKTPEKY